MAKIKTRIIPARAGFTRPQTDRKSTSRDHPRSRGVYHSTIMSRPYFLGSSPLARGLHHHSLPFVIVDRIIPARAGFTPGGTGCAKPRKDHPRSRGVYPVKTGSGRPVAGSSPLARGLPRPRPRRRYRLWIIPARAGFTTPPGRARLPGGGSSPLARGLHRVLSLIEETRRIIPARAGFTCVFRAGRRRMGDHPRSRGVYRPRRRQNYPTAGSSPLARGLRLLVQALRDQRRIIPARAGFTSGSRTTPSLRRDHSRSRGVYQGYLSADHISWGSSPLARGLLTYVTTDYRKGRIIPARARFTRIHLPRAAREGDHPRSRGVYFGRRS